MELHRISQNDKKRYFEKVLARGQGTSLEQTESIIVIYSLVGTFLARFWSPKHVLTPKKLRWKNQPPFILENSAIFFAKSELRAPLQCTLNTTRTCVLGHIFWCVIFLEDVVTRQRVSKLEEKQTHFFCSPFPIYFMHIVYKIVSNKLLRHECQRG